METAKNEEHMLPSKKIYDRYSKINVKLDNITKCADLTIYFPNLPDISKLCHRLKMNLKDFNTKNKNDQTVKYNCEYLHYWMNDRVINELKVIDDAQYIAIITKLHVEWIKINKMLDTSKYICKPTIGPLISLGVDEFEFRKEMYDYYYNYLNIKMWEYSNIHSCSETCKYLTSINENYEKFKSECSHSNNKCIPEFNNFVENNLKPFIHQLRCNTQSECNKDNVLVPDDTLERTTVAEDSIQDQTVQDNTEGSMKNSNRMAILNVALPASVFFVLFPMLYKMTPLGSWFGKANKIRKNIINDLKNEEGEYFLTHAFEQESMKSSDKTYNISYNNT